MSDEQQHPTLDDIKPEEVVHHPESVATPLDESVATLHHHHHDPHDNVHHDPHAEQEHMSSLEPATEKYDGSAADDYFEQPNKWSKNGFGAPVSKQSGKFSKAESEIVKESIEEYCTAKQITVARLCSECEHKAELKGAWMEIAKRLPHRSVQSVYRHGIRQCHPFKRGAWSEQECALLREYVARLGKKWSAIQSKLNRSADSCRDKYREMSDDYVKGRWKEEETEELKRIIVQTLNHQTHGATEAISDMRELGRLVDTEHIQIPWSSISKKMGKRSRLSCFKKWQKMTGLLGPPHEKRFKPLKPFPNTAGAAAAAAMAATTTVAELAAETVEALELPDTEVLHHTTTGQGGGGVYEETESKEV